MGAAKITKRVVDGAIAGSANAFVWDQDVRGFGLKVTPAGSKSYVLQYRMGGREAATKRFTIGKHGSPWTPDGARREAERLLTLVRQGIDPADVERERRRNAVTLSFSDYADRFVELYLKEHWADSWTEGRRIIDKNIKPVFGSRPLSSITRADVSLLLDRYVDRPAMKKNTHSVLRKLFKWAANRGDIATSPIAEMQGPKAVPSRKRVLTHEEIVCAWLAAGEMGYPWRPVIRLLIATLQRRDEVAGLVWGELDVPAAMWELPPERAKNDEGHRVALADLAIEEIDALPRNTKGFLFTTTGRTAVSGFSDAKERLDERMLTIMRARVERRGGDADDVGFVPWRFHDLRRTGTTNLQALGVPVEVTEAVINHISGTTAGVAGVYNRFKYDPQKKLALAAWDTKLQELLAAEQT
jgi:integrase